MTLRGSLVTKCALAYLCAPTVVFLLGWLRWELGVPAALLAGTALACAFRRKGAGESLEPLSEPAEELRISPWVALALVGCIVIWCIMAGQGGFVVIPLVAVFLFSNPQSSALVFGWTAYGTAYFLKRGILFVSCEVGLYFLLTFRAFRTKTWRWSSLVWLCACPAIVIGGGADFCMRASIPALMCLSAMTYLSVVRYWEKQRWRSVALMACLAVGAYVPRCTRVWHDRLGHHRFRRTRSRRSTRISKRFTVAKRVTTLSRSAMSITMAGSFSTDGLPGDVPRR